jgi:hypothetical protein
MTIDDLIVALKGAEDLIGGDASVFVLDVVSKEYHLLHEVEIKFMDKSVNLEVSI